MVRWAWPLSLLAAGATLGTLVPRLDGMACARVRIGLALLGMVCALWHARDAARGGVAGIGRTLRRASLSALCLVGVLNYYHFDSDEVTGVDDYYDATYYYLNSKYFDELGYYDLYRAILLADEEGARRLDYVRTARDLHTYEVVPRRELMRDRDALRGRFTDARFSAFQADADYLVVHKGERTLDYFFHDHGYNPPPTWTFLGGLLTRHIPVSKLKWITSVDALLLLAAFALAWRAFGVDAVLFGLLFMTATTSGLWPLVGQAILRFDWLAASLSAMALWRLGHAGWAGGLLAYATLVRIFPAIFMFPYLVSFVREAYLRWNAGTPPGLVLLSARSRRFIAGAAAGTVLLGGAALLDSGPGAMADAAHNLAMHGSAESYSSLRVGLGDALIFRGERYWIALREVGSIPGKAERLAALAPTLRVATLAVLALLAFFVWRTRAGEEAQPPILQLGYFAFFALTTPQINYHNSRLLLVVWHALALRPRRDAVGLCLLLGAEVMAQVSILDEAIRYTMTSMSSVGLTVYAIAMLGSLAREAGAAGAGAPAPRVGPVGAGIVALAALALVFTAYWEAGTPGRARVRLDADAARAVQESGARSDAAHCHTLDSTGAQVTFDAPIHTPRIDLSVDSDDRARLVFERGGRPIGHIEVRGHRRDGRGRLSRIRHQVPKAIAKPGFDSVRVIPLRGDRHFCLGHLVPWR